jgi:site-specific recombinase XerD
MSSGRDRAVTLHAARHTSVTTMLASGAPLRTVAAWHGHDPVVAARTYDHVDQADLAAAGEALFGPGVTKSVTK